MKKEPRSIQEKGDCELVVCFMPLQGRQVAGKRQWRDKQRSDSQVTIPWGNGESPREWGALRPSAACVSGLVCWDSQPLRGGSPEHR